MEEVLSLPVLLENVQELQGIYVRF